MLGGAVIKLSDEILDLTPVLTLSSTKEGLTAAAPPSGADTEGMAAARELLGLCMQMESLLQSYSSLIGYDADRVSRIIAEFRKSDS